MNLKEVNKRDPEELNKLFEFLVTQYNAPRCLLPQNTDDLIKSPKRFFIAYEEGKIIGCSGFSVFNNHRVETGPTVIHKDLRGQGMGRTLNEKMELYYRSIGAQKITCNIYVDNLVSIVLKLKMGYQFEGRLLNHDKMGQDEYIMGKEL